MWPGQEDRSNMANASWECTYAMNLVAPKARTDYAYGGAQVARGGHEGNKANFGAINLAPKGQVDSNNISVPPMARAVSFDLLSRQQKIDILNTQQGPLKARPGTQQRGRGDGGLMRRSATTSAMRVVPNYSNNPSAMMPPAECNSNAAWSFCKPRPSPGPTNPPSSSNGGLLSVVENDREIRDLLQTIKASKVEMSKGRQLAMDEFEAPPTVYDHNASHRGGGAGGGRNALHRSASMNVGTSSSSTAGTNGGGLRRSASSTKSILRQAQYSNPSLASSLGSNKLYGLQRRRSVNNVKFTAPTIHHIATNAFQEEEEKDDGRRKQQSAGIIKNVPEPSAPRNGSATEMNAGSNLNNGGNAAVAKEQPVRAATQPAHSRRSDGPMHSLSASDGETESEGSSHANGVNACERPVATGSDPSSVTCTFGSARNEPNSNHAPPSSGNERKSKRDLLVSAMSLIEEDTRRMSREEAKRRESHYTCKDSPVAPGSDPSVNFRSASNEPNNRVPPPSGNKKTSKKDRLASAMALVEEDTRRMSREEAKRRETSTCTDSDSSICDAFESRVKDAAFKSRRGRQNCTSSRSQTEERLPITVTVSRSYMTTPGWIDDELDEYLFSGIKSLSAHPIKSSGSCSSLSSTGSRQPSSPC